MSLTLEEVRRVRFRMAKRNVTGYEVGDVDTFIDKVEETFSQFENERELLRREADSMRNASEAGDPNATAEDDGAKESEIAALRAEVDRLKSEAAAAPSAPTAQMSNDDDGSGPTAGHVERLSEENSQLGNQNDELRAELARVRSELDEVRTARVSEVAGQVQTIKVGTRDDASPAVIRLVQLATEQAEQVVEEADAEVIRKIEDAKQQAYEITTDARTKAERVESEARVNAEQMTREATVNAEQVTREADSRAQHVDTEAANRRTELFSDLEREQGDLTQKVDALRSFESSFRSNLKGYLNKQLGALDEDMPEPADQPELAVRGSDTPRLDALAQGHDG